MFPQSSLSLFGTVSCFRFIKIKIHFFVDDVPKYQNKIFVSLRMAKIQKAVATFWGTLYVVISAQSHKSFALSFAANQKHPEKSNLLFCRVIIAINHFRIEDA